MTSGHWDKAYPPDPFQPIALVTRSEVHDFTTSNVTYAIRRVLYCTFPTVSPRLMVSAAMSTPYRSPLLVHIVFSLLLWSSHSFVIQNPSSCHTPSELSMISMGSNKQRPEFPRDVKDAVSKCRAAVQEALSRRLSRMDVEFPVGTKFGVEKTSGKKQRTAQGETPSRALFETSDRELARLFVEMFQPVGGENIAVVFTDESLADKARKSWKGDAGAAACLILSAGRRKSASKNKKKPLGFAAKLAAEVDDDSSGPFSLPDNIEVALFVAPGPKELLVVEKTCAKVGMGTLVVLLNARLSSFDNFGSPEAVKLFMQDFEPVFHLGAASPEAAPGCLLYRTYPSNWMVARKPKVGQPKVIMTQADRPTEEDLTKAYEGIKMGDLEKNVENALDNVAGWFS